MNFGFESLMNVTVFILATTKLGLDGKSLFETRSHPLLSTWGSYFKNIYFVVGFDRNEVKYLSMHCTLFRKFTSINEPLNIQVSAGESRAPRRPFNRNFLHEYRCPVPITPVVSDFESPRLHGANGSSYADTVSRSNATHYTATVLLTGNCTAAYFGHGPTCRLQESLRYYYQHVLVDSRSSGDERADWLAFMDDDIYIRPLALRFLLSRLSNPMQPVYSNNKLDEGEKWQSSRAGTFASGADDRLALIAASKYRNLQYSNRWNRSEHSCGETDVFDFPLAQPAFLNSAALASLERAVAHNELTELHRLWGGSHDILLGLLLWIHRIPVVSFHKSYHGARLFKDVHTATEAVPFDPAVTFIFHKVTNSLLSYRDGGGKSKSVFGHVDMARYLNETGLYTNQGSAIDQVVLTSRRIAERAVQELMFMKASRINETSFALRQQRETTSYAYFSPVDCALGKQ